MITILKSRLFEQPISDYFLCNIFKRSIIIMSCIEHKVLGAQNAEFDSAIVTEHDNQSQPHIHAFKSI